MIGFETSVPSNESRKTTSDVRIGMRDGKVVKEVLKSKRSKNEYVVIDSFGGVQIPQEILSKSKIDSKASLTSDKTKISLNKILKRKK